MQNEQVIRSANVVILVLILLGSFLAWEKNNEGQDFLDNYVKDQTKWMIIDLILFAMLVLLIVASRGSKRQNLYVVALVAFLVVKMLHMQYAKQLQSADKPSGGHKAHLNDMFYTTMLNGFLLGMATTCLMCPHGK